MTTAPRQSNPLEPRGDVETFRRLFVSAEALLTARAAQIDRLNVFPVPDGDTGTNLSLTLRAAVQSGLTASASGVGGLSATIARGALLGARGNSGVILSQYLRGFAEGLAGVETADSAAFRRALASAADAARAAVPQAVEGTILTVAREVATATASADGSLVSILNQATDAAHLAVSRTPEQLAVLRQAGVVDAGALGLATILEGMLRGARGEAIVAEANPATASPDLHGGETTYGYCTQFLIHGEALNPAIIRERFADQGESLLVVGDATLVRVHLHTYTPGKAIDRAIAFGTIDAITIDDMQGQAGRLRGTESPGSATGTPIAPSKSGHPAEPAQTGLVVVSPGAGFGRLFQSLGAGALVTGGQSSNPSIGEILAAVRSVPADATILLPNNSNVLLAAQQAGDSADRPVVVVPTRDAAQGVAAALAFRADRTVEENQREMVEAMASIRTAKVTQAARDAQCGEIAVRAGDWLGLIYDEPVLATTSLVDAITGLLETLQARGAELITLYFGIDVSPDERDSLGAQLQTLYPDQQIDFVAGEQEHYPFILACE